MLHQISRFQICHRSMLGSNRPSLERGAEANRGERSDETDSDSSSPGLFLETLFHAARGQHTTLLRMNRNRLLSRLLDLPKTDCDT
mmetsp:Transcript_18702/g.27856  ORF Transcript_18702/g.27856 Transcript_18702/m.27856 type:complete len:86 (-) Transcript_18702:838-1095(-)